MSSTLHFSYPVTTLAADGNVPSASPWYGHQGGRVMYAAQGDFGGGTTTLQFSLDGGSTWTSIGGATTLTGSGAAGAELPPCHVRVNLASSSSPDLDIKLGHTGGDRMTG